jgi:VIT1/CCC1 family predicted Fe2+/Mn2+ transporter
LSVVLTAFTAIAVGWVIGRFTDRHRWRTALRQLFIATVAASVTFGIGKLVGVNVS